jgi:hypothetical protein
MDSDSELCFTKHNWMNEYSIRYLPYNLIQVIKDYDSNCDVY